MTAAENFFTLLPSSSSINPNEAPLPSPLLPPADLSSRVFDDDSRPRILRGVTVAAAALTPLVEQQLISSVREDM